jgi:hypothetical protein
MMADGSVVTANIVKWDPTYNCIIIEGEQASMFDPTSDSPLSTYDGSAWAYTDGDTSTLFSFTKAVPYEYAIHHFEDSDGNVLDPRQGLPSDLNSPSSILDRYVKNLDFVEVLAIDNRTQEFKDNDKKRSIRVIKPEFMGTIITQFRSLFE